MHLEIQKRETEGITILDLKGRLILGPEDLSLRERALALLDRGTRRLIVDLKDVSHIDTAGFGSLLFCSEKFRSSGGRLVIANLGPEQVSASNILQLEITLEIYSTELDAVNSFFPDRVVPHYDILQLVEELKNRRAADQTGKNRKR